MRLPCLLNTIRRLRTAAVVCGMAATVGLIGGCDVPSFFDPGEMAGLTQRGKEPLKIQILDELDPTLEQANRDFATAQPPTPEDFKTEPADYTVGPNDLLQVTVYDLEGPGLQTIKQTRVSGTGNITLPYLNSVVRDEGLSELELQQAVADALRKVQCIVKRRFDGDVVNLCVENLFEIIRVHCGSNSAWKAGILAACRL